MATISDMKMKYRIFMKTYKYRSLEWKSGVSLEKPLKKSRIAVVSTAAIYTPDQPPFDPDIDGGDHSFRVIPDNVDMNSLRTMHPSSSFDHRGIEADVNLSFPLDRLKELREEGFLSSPAPRHLSFMGLLLSPEKLVEESSEKAADILIEDRVDGALLIPV